MKLDKNPHGLESTIWTPPMKLDKNPHGLESTIWTPPMKLDKSPHVTNYVTSTIIAILSLDSRVKFGFGSRPILTLSKSRNNTALRSHNCNNAPQWTAGVIMMSYFTEVNFSSSWHVTDIPSTDDDVTDVTAPLIHPNHKAGRLLRRTFKRMLCPTEQTATELLRQKRKVVRT